MPSSTESKCKYETDVQFSSFTDIGTRNYQEDVLQYRCVSDRFHLFTICDGHGGSNQCATFTANEMENQIEMEVHRAEEAIRADKVRLIPLLERVVNRVVRMWDIKSFGESLLQIQCEKERELFFKDVHVSSAKTCTSSAETEKMSLTDRCSGSTLTTILIDAGSYPVRIAAAYLGDSKFTIKKDSDGTCFVSRDHVPLPNTLPPSVVQAYPSSHVQDRRLNGVLAMTHAVGDNTVQLFGCVQRAPSTFFCTSRSSFCICMGSDGFWDVFPDAHENLAFVESGARAERFLEHRKNCFKDNASVFCITGRTYRRNRVIVGSSSLRPGVTNTNSLNLKTLMTKDESKGKEQNHYPGVLLPPTNE